MKKLSLSVAVFMLSVGVLLAQAKVHARTFTGAIMDSQCASMGNHDAGYKMTGTTTPKDCTLACVKAGSQFVLYNAATKSTYKLDDQTKPKDFAGENVKVIGTYNRRTKTIHVEKIEAGQ